MGLSILFQKNTFILMRVPGHWECEGNEAADGLAKKSAQSRFIEPDPLCDLI